MKKLVGFYNGISKKSGKAFTIAYLLCDLSTKEIENGSFGQKVEECFLPMQQAGDLTSKDIGHEVSLSYEVNNGRAFLVDFVVK